MLYIPLGPPGSGKSTLAERMINTGRLTADAVVSPDHYRWILTGDIQDQSANKQVFEICDRITWYRLYHGRDVFIDATNLTNYTQSINLAKDTNQHFEVILMPWLSLEELMARQRERGRKIPLEDMERMMDRYRLAIEDLLTSPHFVHGTVLSTI